MKNIPKAAKLLALTLAVVLAGCNHAPTLPLVAYVQYMEAPEHDFCKEVKAGDINYTIQLATPEYMAAKELADADGHIADTAYAKRLKEMEGYAWLVIHITDKKGQNPQTQEQMVMYYEQPASADLRLTCAGTELTPSSYHFENNYGLTPYNTIVAAFATGNVHKGQTLEMNFNDRFHNQPLLKAAFTTDGLPRIQL